LIFYGILFSSIVILFLGASRRIVIYMNEDDLIANAAVPGISIVMVIIASTFGETSILRTLILYLAGLFWLGGSVYTFRQSTIFNSFLSLPLNVIVAIFKLAFSQIAILFILLQIGRVFSDRETVGSKILAIILAGLTVKLMTVLVNGEQVYAEKGLTLPSPET
jgi:hypothetical protein